MGHAGSAGALPDGGGIGGDSLSGQTIGGAGGGGGGGLGCPLQHLEAGTYSRFDFSST